MALSLYSSIGISKKRPISGMARRWATMRQRAENNRVATARRIISIVARFSQFCVKSSFIVSTQAAMAGAGIGPNNMRHRAGEYRASS